MCQQSHMPMIVALAQATERQSCIGDILPSHETRVTTVGCSATGSSPGLSGNRTEVRLVRLPGADHAKSNDNDWKHRRTLTLGLVAANQYHQIVASREFPKFRHIFRLLALACATCCGVFFLVNFFVLAWIYFHHSPQQFPLFITARDFSETALFGVGFVCFGIGYLILSRKPNPRA